MLVKKQNSYGDGAGKICCLTGKHERHKVRIKSEMLLFLHMFSVPVNTVAFLPCEGCTRLD